jgi:uncharacterized membrane protein/glutaredoxin
MIRRHVLQIGSAVLIIGWLWLATFAVPSSAAQGAGTPTPVPTPRDTVVRVVAFTMTGCLHCQETLDEALLPIRRTYGAQLEVLTVDIHHADGAQLREAAIETFAIPKDRVSVPTLIVGDQVLVGSGEIAEQLPPLIESHLRAGGVDWPAISGIDAFLQPPAVTPSPPPYFKTCHACEEDEAEAAPTRTATPAALPAIVAPPGPEKPIVHAVMFWMDGCPHCHDVIDHVLPPLQQKYGEQFDLQLIEVVTTEDIDRLYEVGAAFGLVKEQVGVPFLIIGDRVLVGSDQIPAELPQLIERHLTGGGVAYPTAPGLPQPTAPDAGCSVATPCADSAAPSSAGVVSADTAAHIAPVSNGFALAVVIMVGMVGALAYSGFTVIRRPVDTSASTDTRWRDIAFVTLTLIGLGVAGYLAYVETQAVAAVCGPVGDCNAVQTSEYAYLFGVLPIGVLGVGGYVLILIAWLWGRLRSDRVAEAAPLIVWGLTVFGVVFSLYLTFLEPFVIKAVCIWCLTSAVIMTLLMLLSLRPARISLARRRSKE